MVNCVDGYRLFIDFKKKIIVFFRAKLGNTLNVYVNDSPKMQQNSCELVLIPNKNARIILIVQDITYISLYTLQKYSNC